VKTLAMTFLLFAASSAYGQHIDTEAEIFPATEMKWKNAPKTIPAGAKIAILEGDPTKNGPFVMRLKLPDGYKIPAHTHPKTERLTVISGTFHIVMGDLDPKKAQAMPAGSFGHWPAGMKHMVWTEGETIVQLHGFGPWEIHYVNPADDPRRSTTEDSRTKK
jgi:anti-sigma factor ChrR (cupin superfamily)